MLAGAPAILGMWLGSLAYSPHWAAFALAIGAGAIFRLSWKFGSISAVRTTDGKRSVPISVFGGLVAGVPLMYATAVLVKV